jgi:hypothetical protein
MVSSSVVNRHMEEALATVDPKLYRMVASRELLVGIVYHSRARSIRFRLMSPSSVFTAEFTAISVALIHIFFEAPWDYVILTDFSSYSSARLRLQTKKYGSSVKVAA